MTKNFALIGAAGYVAPRHMRAIKETNNRLVCALDPHDSVGIIDSFFPEADFFVEFERFDRHIDKLRRRQQKIDYVSICSPNYLHDSHIRFALRQQADAICEKPLVLNPWNIDALAEIEKEGEQQINNILQLRLHPSIQKLKGKLESEHKKRHAVDLTYIASRGRWYHYSWKGDDSKSGGIVTNIGIHFFDMLIWLFGDVQQNEVHLVENDKAAGCLKLQKADIRWFLSIDKQTLPQEAVQKKQQTYRSITIDGHEIEFSGGFTDLHTRSYEEILAGRGFKIADVRPCIETAYNIRHSKIVSLKGDYHPFLSKV